jgi:hypothetical protein
MSVFLVRSSRVDVLSRLLIARLELLMSGQIELRSSLALNRSWAAPTRDPMLGIGLHGHGDVIAGLYNVRHSVRRALA